MLKRYYDDGTTRKVDGPARDAGAVAGEGASRAFDLLPAIDLRGGRVVRLRHGDFGQETMYGDDPVSVAEAFARDGARWLHVVDLDGARDPSRRQVALVAAVVAAVGTRTRVEVAGGLRDEAAVATVLATGATRAVVGTAALRDPAFVGRVVRAHGTTRIAVALDVRGDRAVGEGWVADAAGQPLEEVLRRLGDEGAAAFEVTAIDRDGTLEGPDVALLRKVIGWTRADVVASAGIRSTADIATLRELGCAGAIVGRALYEGMLGLADALAAAGESASPS